MKAFMVFLFAIGSVPSVLADLSVGGFGMAEMIDDDFKGNSTTVSAGGDVMLQEYGNYAAFGYGLATGDYASVFYAEGGFTWPVKGFHLGPAFMFDGYRYDDKETVVTTDDNGNPVTKTFRDRTTISIGAAGFKDVGQIRIRGGLFYTGAGLASRISAGWVF